MLTAKTIMLHAAQEREEALKFSSMIDKVVYDTTWYYFRRI